MTASPSTTIAPKPIQAPPPFLSNWTLSNPQVGLCGNHDHFAIIYDNPDDQLDFIVPYLRLGLERGEKSVFIYDDNSAETVIAAMERHGIDVAAASGSGALSIITKSHAYMKNGNFDPDWMVDFLAQAVVDAKKEGFSAVRASGEMTWALGPAGDAHDRLVEYECKLNAFFPNYDMSGICQYNRRRFRAQTLMHVIHTHQRVVFRGDVCENPYYIPSDILQSQDDEMGSAVHRLLESMAENTRLRRQLAAESEALLRSEKLAVAGRMAAIVAHEINNPLEALITIHYLLQHEDLPATTHKYIDILGEELDRVCQLSKRTLEAFKVAASAGGTDLSKLD
jgi:MEDS: MEthanogen/methylotroph, DcmR Sensory domain/His Kinase A (phospho-acceptor) domain